MIEVIWKDIEGFEKRYMVSSAGEVLSINYKNTGKARLLKPAKRKSGWFVMLSDYKWYAVHELVARSFIQECHENKIVKHKDGNVFNNSADNLEWINKPVFMDLENEEWRDIEGYEGLYQVSNLGRVRSFQLWHGNKEGYLRKPVFDGKKTKVPSVLLKKDGQSEMWWISRLVANAFVNGYMDGYQIIHKDGDVTNNRADNLKWESSFFSLEDEEWRDVVGYEALYEVSNLGRVRSLNYRGRKEYHILEPIYSTSGYYDVSLSKGKKSKHHRIHRLVAMAFVDGYKPELFVNHKDENRLNNRADNLEWLTHAENNAYGTARERMTYTICNAVGVEVERIDESGRIIASYKSISAASRSVSKSPSVISNYCKKGLHGWRFKGDTNVTSVKTARYVVPKCEDTEPETWKEIEGYVGLYQVSSKGRVKSLPHKVWNGFNYCVSKERILKPMINRRGYPIVELYKNKKGKKYSVHRLVAKAFVQNNDPTKTIVNHINEDRSDARAVNLEWVTNKENINYGSCYKKRGQSMSKVMNDIVGRRNRLGLYGAEKPVRCIDTDGCLVAEYRSCSEAARAMNVSNTSKISACCKGKRLSAYGYYWQYIADGNHTK